MTVITPPRPPSADGRQDLEALRRQDAEALEALIEEARRRAQRRRRRNGAVVVLAVAAGVAAFVGFGGRGGGGTGTAAPDRTPGAQSPGSGGRPAPLGALPPDSGLPSAFAFDASAPGTVYVGTLSGRVYRTADAGAHWRSTKRPVSTRVDALAADPTHPATLYAGTGVAVYKTVNGGRSWRAWNRGLLPPPPVIAPGQATGTPGWRRAEGWVGALMVDPIDSTIVYAGTGGGLKKSTDGGHSWKTVLWHGRYMGISALAITPARPHVVYAAAFVDEPANCGAGGNIRCRLRTVLYKSADGGKNWQPTGLRRSNPKGNFAALALDPRRPSTLYAAIGSTVLRSTDAGRKWQSIAHGFSGRNVNSLAVDPRRPGTVYAASWGAINKEGPSGGIFKTTNGGLTWSRTSVGFPAYVVAIDPAHPATIYAAGSAGVDHGKYPMIRSTDSGRTWVTAG